MNNYVSRLVAWAPVFALTLSIMLIGMLIATLVLLTTHNGLYTYGASLDASIKLYSPVKAASTSTDTLADNPDVIDDVAITMGDRVLFMNESNPQNNGVYIKSFGKYERSADMNQAYQIMPGNRISVAEGASHAGSRFELAASTAQMADKVDDIITGAGIIFVETGANQNLKFMANGGNTAATLPGVAGPYFKVWKFTFDAGEVLSPTITVDGDTNSSYMIELNGYLSGAGSCLLILNNDVRVASYGNTTTKQRPGVTRARVYGPNYSDISNTPTNPQTGVVQHLITSGGISLGATESAGSLNSVVYLSGSSGREKVATGSWGCRETKKTDIGYCFSGTLGAYYSGTENLKTMQVQIKDTKFKGTVSIYARKG